jgi:hypothetical protein
MEFDNLIKLSGSEVTKFIKRNAESFAVVSDLMSARDNCDTKGARDQIQTLIAPMMKDVQRECASFDTKMAAIWKRAKGEVIPAGTQKKLDSLIKNGEKSLKSKNSHYIKFGSYSLNGVQISSYSL